MSRETRFNLLFFVGLVLVSLPGIIIMFKKKLDPASRPWSEPPYVRRTEAYNNPQEAGTSSVRVVPPATARWVESLAADRIGAAPLRHSAAGGRLEPVMSQRRRLELLDVQAEEAATTIILLAWSEEFGRERVTRVEASAEAGGLGRLLSVEIEPVQVPREIVEELKYEGYVRPPGSVGLIWLKFAAPTGERGGPRISLTWRGPDFEGADVLDLSGMLPARPEPAKDGEARPAADDPTGTPPAGGYGTGRHFIRSNPT